MNEKIKYLLQKTEEDQATLFALKQEKELLLHDRLYQEQVARNKLFLIKREQFLLVPFDSVKR